MNNPFEVIDRRLSNIEEMLLDIKHKPSYQKEDEQEDLLTVPQAAKFLTLSVGTVYGLVSSRTIPFMKKGKRVYFLKSELMEYLKSGRGKSLAELSELAEKHVHNKKRPR